MKTANQGRAARLLLAALLAGAASTWSVQGQSYTNKASGSWSAAGSWSTGIPLAGGGSGVAVVFSNALADASANNLAGTFALNSLTFAAPNTVTLTGSALAYTNNGAVLPQVTLDVDRTMSIANAQTLAASTTFYVNQNVLTNTGVLSGPGSLTKTGAGHLVLSALSAYSGGTTIGAGTVTVTATNGLGVAAVTNNGVLNLTASSGSYTALSGSTPGTLAGSGTNNVTQGVVLNGDYSAFTGTWNLGVGALPGSGSGGKTTMNGADNSAQVVNVLSNSTLYVSAYAVKNAGIVLYGGTLGEIYGQLRLESGSVWSGPVTLAGPILGPMNGTVGCNGSHVAMISGTIGETNGSWGLSKSGGGSSILYLAASNTYSGATLLVGGSLTITNANGTIRNSSGIGFNGGKTLLLDNTGINNNDRIANTVALSLGGELSLAGNASVDTLESFGNLGIDTGDATVTVRQGNAGRVATFAASSFSRANSATALVRGTSLGQQNAQVGKISFDSTSGLTFIGAGGQPAGTGTTKTLGIVPYLVGDATYNGSGSGLVTYDTSYGSLRPLAANEYTTLTANYTTPGTAENAKAFNGTLVTTGGVTLNSLLFGTANQTLNGSGGALTLSSGALLATASGSSLGGGFSGLALGNDVWNEGVVSVNSGSTFTINPAITVTGNGGLTKGGAGTLVLAGSNTYSGATTVNAGTLQLGNGGVNGSLAGSLTLCAGAANVGLRYNRTAQASPVGGTIVNVLGGGSGVVNLFADAGALVFNDVNLPAGSLNPFGTLTIASGASFALNGAASSTSTFNSLSTTGGKLLLQRGTNIFNAFGPSSAYVWQSGGVSFLSSYANNISMNSGYYWLSAGTLINGNLAGSYGYWLLSKSGVGVLDMSGGTFTCGSGGGGVSMVLAGASGATGVLYQTSGTINVPQGSATLFVMCEGAIGSAARAEMTIADGSDNMAGGSLLFGYQNQGGTAFLNLNGGSLQLKAIGHGVSGCAVNSTINFNGGKLVANQASSSFMVASNVYLYAKGATIDSGGYAVTITQPLAAPFGQGVVDLPWGGTLMGYSGAPYVALSGGSGTGATAVALFDYTSGSVTGVVVTCAGVGYQPGDTVSVKLLGGGHADVSLDAAVLGSNVSGGLTKLGTGTLTLSGASTYTGATVVSNGTLSVASTNLLASTDWVIASTATNKFGSGVNLAGKTLTVDAAGVSAGLLYATGDLKLGGKLTVLNLEEPRKIAQCSGAATGTFDTIETPGVVAYVVNGNEVWVKKTRGMLVRIL